MSNPVSHVSHAQAQRPDPAPRLKTEPSKPQARPAATVSVSNAAESRAAGGFWAQVEAARAASNVAGQAQRLQAKAAVATAKS